ILSQAIDNLTQMRAVEGAALWDDLKQHCQQMQKGLEQIRKRSGVVPLEYAEKLKKRVDTLLAAAELKLDEETLAREVAIFAERSDISEELTRLDSHIEQFEKSCKGDGAVGRKLDFISQEMLREANTIASKAMDSDIIEAVVDIKCRVDRIKEQVQNIE
ncbi:MAG: YicC family protein, partial [Planctomycetota bacterium]